MDSDFALAGQFGLSQPEFAAVRADLDERAPGWSAQPDGRIRLRTTPSCHIDIVSQLFGVALVKTDLGDERYWTCGWSYTGPSPREAIGAAIDAGLPWDGSPASAPLGWTKELATH